MGIWGNGENFPFYGSWVGFEGTKGREGVSRRRVERELVKYNQGGPDLGVVEGPRSAGDAPAEDQLEGSEGQPEGSEGQPEGMH